MDSGVMPSNVAGFSTVVGASAGVLLVGCIVLLDRLVVVFHVACFYIVLHNLVSTDGVLTLTI